LTKVGEQKLPAQFAELEGFLGWSLATERERTAKRQTSSMREIKAFYDAIVPRLDELLDYLNDFPQEDVSSDVQRLFLLSMSLAEIAPAVENFGQPSVIDGYDYSRFVPIHD
jgi:hypothetical protein